MYIILITFLYIYIFFLLMCDIDNIKTEIKNCFIFFSFFCDLYIFINLLPIFCQYELFLDMNWFYQISLGSTKLSFMIDEKSLYFITLSLNLTIMSNWIMWFLEGSSYKSCI